MSVFVRKANTAVREFPDQEGQGNFANASTQTNDECRNEMDLDSWEFVFPPVRDNKLESWPATVNRLRKPHCVAPACNRPSSPPVPKSQAIIRKAELQPQIQGLEMATQRPHSSQHKPGIISDGESSVDPMANSIFSVTGRRLSFSTNASDGDSAIDKLPRNSQTIGAPFPRAAQEDTMPPQAPGSISSVSKTEVESSDTTAQPDQLENQTAIANLPCCDDSKHKEWCEFCSDPGTACLEDDFWEWDRETQKYRHWDSEDEEYIYCPDEID